MSFILDALKKSEQERPPKAVPDVHTVHGQPPRPPRRRRLWPGLLVFALLLNASLLLLWLRPWGGPEQSELPAPLLQAPSEPPPVMAASQVAAASAVEEVRVPEPVVAPATLRPRSTPAVETPSPRPSAVDASPREEKKNVIIEAGPAPVAGGIQDFDRLPSDVRRSVPPFEISLHFYTEAPASRMVRINGRNLREGDDLVAGFALEKITPSGVVLAWKGHRFRAGNY